MKLLLMLALIVLSACKSTVQGGSSDTTLNSLAKSKLGDEVVINKNSNETFALCFKQNNTINSITYLIVRLSDLQVVEQNTIPNASFKWIDTYQVEIKEIPGIVMKDETDSNRKIIDVTHFIIKQ